MNRIATELKDQAKKLEDFLTRYEYNSDSPLYLSKTDRANIIAMHDIYRLHMSKGNLDYILSKFDQSCTTYPSINYMKRTTIVKEAEIAGLFR